MKFIKKKLFFKIKKLIIRISFLIKKNIQFPTTLKKYIYPFKQNHINIRGGLGNQIIQTFVGMAIMYEKNNKNFDICFNYKMADEHQKYFFQINKCVLKQLFSIKKDVIEVSSSQKKTRYWNSGSIKILHKNYDKVFKNISLLKYKKSNIKVAIHVRSIGDEKGGGSSRLYEKIIKSALLRYKKVCLLGDNPILINNLCRKFSDFNVFHSEETTAINDWRLLVDADVIYCTPSTFSLSTKLVDPKKKIYVINPFDYTFYQNGINDYTFLFELKKYFGNIKILDPLLLEKNNFSEILKLQNPHTYYLSNLNLQLSLGKIETHEIKHNIKDLIFKNKIICETLIKQSGLKGLTADNLLIKDNFPFQIYKYLEARIFSLRLNQTFIEDSSDIFKKYFLSTKNNFNSFYPPIIEESGLSLERQFLFGTSYISRGARIFTKSSKRINNYDKFLKFHQEGYLLIKNIFSDEENNEIKSLFQIKEGSTSKNNQTLFFRNHRNTNFAKTLLSDEFLNLLTLLTTYSKNTIMKELMRNTFKRTDKPHENFKSNNTFYIDNFYPSFKLWYFPFDVSIEETPIEYALSTNLPSFKIMKKLQQKYLKNAYKRNYNEDSNFVKKSIEIMDNELLKSGYKIKRESIPANSLLIINVSGFYKYLFNNKLLARHSIHSSISPNNIFDKKIYETF